MSAPMSDYITTVALINGEPTTVSFTRAFLESLFSEPAPAVASPAVSSEQQAILTLEELAQDLRKQRN